MAASNFRSRTWFNAAAEAAANQIPSEARSTRSSEGRPCAASSMPTIPVNTIVATTFGLVSSQYLSRQRLAAETQVVVASSADDMPCIPQVEGDGLECDRGDHTFA